MRILPPCLTLGVAAAAWLLPTHAAAAPPGEGFSERGFVYGSPGILAIPIGEEDVSDQLDPGWQWSVGGGYMLTPAPYFKLGIGAAFEHAIYNIEDDGFSVGDGVASGDTDGNMIRLVPEVRIGAGIDRVWGYGLIGAGLALSVIDWHAQAIGFTTEGDDTDAGFNLQLGAGVQGLVWRNLMIGGELDFDLAFMGNDDQGEEGECIAVCDDDYGIHTLGIKVLIGWYF